MCPDFSNELQPLGPGASLPAVIGTCLGGDSPSCQDILTDGTVGRAGFLQGFLYLKLLDVINHTHCRSGGK